MKAESVSQGWKGELTSPALEERYRSHVLHYDKARSAKFAYIGLATIAALTISDRRLFAGTGKFTMILLVRLAMIAFWAMVPSLIRRCRDRRAFDGLVMFWLFLTVAFIVFVDATRPRTYMGHVFVDVAVVLGIYAVFPAPLAAQTTAAVSLSAAIGALFATVKAPLDPAMRAALAIALVSANAIGALASWSIHRWKRIEFATLQREVQLREDVEQSLAEVKTLRGMVRRCVRCQRLRGDTGYWQKVEEYVKRHTGAKFSHGICPECMKTHYPEAVE
jgi:hypothetical protein